MITYQGLDRNFTFMVLEVTGQIEATARLLAAPSEKRIHRVASRDNYIDTLKSLIERKCLSYFRHAPTMDKQSANMVTALNVVTTNLERIADFCVNAVLHLRRLEPASFIQRFEYQPYFDELLAAAPLVKDAIAKRDTELALKLCRAEEVLDQLYSADYRRIADALRSGQDTDNLLVCLYIFHYLERMGDSFLNIGEAVLFAVTGEKLKLHDYSRLRQTLGSERLESLVSDYSMDFGWETRSGSRIGKVQEKNGGGEDFEGIFKKGQKDKLRREKDNITRWEQLVPGLPPRVLEFWEEEGDAALLLEFLDGLTFQELIVNGEETMIRDVLGLLKRTLESIWQQTRTDEPVQVDFLKQAWERLDGVFSVHPQFKGRRQRIGELCIRPLEELLATGREIEKSISAPFSVMIHGDFNVDNIIYNNRADSIHFIDLHRSRQADYVQDVSIFLLSNYRLPIFRKEVRRMITGVEREFFTFAADFARRMGDRTFDVRMALGLARAFTTSTRFELNPEFARSMFVRATYLLRSIINHRPRPWEEFELGWELLDY